MATTPLLKLTFFIFFILNSFPKLSFGCPLYQKQALLHFKHTLTTLFNSTSIDIVKLNSWNPNSDCCKWDHVTCDTSTNVTELYLSMVVPEFDNISVPVFSDILTPFLHIRSLKILDISSNSILGQIPEDGFGNLTELVELYMSSNSFSGSIPRQLLQLPNLQVLDLSKNLLKGRIPPQTFELESLRILDLSKNQFTGPIPSSISNLSKLNTLRVQHNKLAGDIPTWLFNITTLRYLYIGGKGSGLVWNNKATIVPRCSLYRISMTNCGISGQVPKWISSQRNLYFLDLSMNQLEGSFPDLLNQTGITGIVLSDNKLTGSIPSHLFEPGRLQILALARNNFFGELPKNIGNAGRMRILVLSGNNFSGEIPMSMSNMSWLNVLDLSKNKFSGDSFPDFGESRFLSAFDFSFNDFFGKVPTSFPTSTQVLSLSGNRFSGNLPSNLTNLVNLQSLDLHGNDITGNFQDVLPQIPTLEVLNLRKNSLEGFIPITISNLSSLRILDLSGNNLTGSIPHEIANLQRMIQTPNTNYTPFGIFFYDYFDDDIDFDDLIVNWKNSFQGLPSHTLGLYSFLDLSNNRISGKIPASLGDLKSLKALNISHNNILGNIPVSFGSLTHIESLDLSHNEISGSIPQSIANLDELSIFDVSNNRLTGKIPTGRHMDTMDELKYYANNSGLCGTQIKITCPEDIPPTEGAGDEEEGKLLSLVFWEGTWVGFPIGIFSSILTMGYFLNFIQLFKFW